MPCGHSRCCAPTSTGRTAPSIGFYALRAFTVLRTPTTGNAISAKRFYALRAFTVLRTPGRARQDPHPPRFYALRAFTVLRTSVARRARDAVPGVSMPCGHSRCCAPYRETGPCDQGQWRSSRGPCASAPEEGVMQVTFHPATALTCSNAMRAPRRISGVQRRAVHGPGGTALLQAAAAAGSYVVHERGSWTACQTIQ
jgi:hypothetical protein